MNVIYQFWREHKGWLVFLVLFTMVSTAVSLAFPFVLRYVVDGIRNHLAPGLILRYAGILLGIGVVRSVIQSLLPMTRGGTNERFAWRTRSRVFDRVLGMGHSFTNKFPSGDVIERLDQDLGELSWFACSGIFRPVEAIFMIVFALIILLRINWLLTLVSVLPVSLAVFVWLRLGPRVYVWYREWREKISEVNNMLEASFSGIRLVKSYSMEAGSARRFHALLVERVRRAIKVVQAEAKIGILFGGISELGVLLVLWVGGILIMKQSLTLGEFIAFNIYILMLIGPMFDIGNFFVAGRRAQAGAERINELQAHVPDVAGTRGQRSLPAGATVYFSDVSFRYAPDKPEALRTVSLAIPPATRVGIAGTVGSGKSTVIRLLLGLAEPTGGRIALDSADVHEFPLARYRALFGYAPQEPTLFSETIERNITFGRTADRPGLLDEVLRVAQLTADLADFPNGREELVGERGLKLSGGQKARVAIARAVFSRPPILILDDTTANLDAETEQKLIRDVLEFMAGSSIVVVSHRLSILSFCDTVYVMDKGEVVESGPHDMLLERRGLYWKLYQHQVLAEELEKS